jgi:iron complex transport system permease protein
MLRVLASRALPIAHDWSDTVETVVFNIRLPRVLLAMCIGGGLSISGAAFQGMFQNPLVSPDILGVTAGAGFGAALAILFNGRAMAIQLSAFLFGIVAVALTYSIGRIYRTTPTLMLVLSGVVVGAIFSALLSLVKYVADPNQKLPAIVFWLMGSLGAATMKDLLTSAPLMLIGTAGLLLVRWQINVLSLGDEEARSLGVRTERLKAVIIVCSTAVTAAAVSVCGIIGWVGMVMPHLGRMLVGPDHKRLLPAAFALGAAYLLVIDDLSRTLISAEIPLGILTAIVGAPFFAYLLRRTKGAWTG